MRIFLSPLAAKKIEILLDYLDENWSIKTREEFLKKLSAKFQQVSDYPESSAKSKEIPNLYKAVVTKQTSIYYRIIENEIEIITVIDNRQDPDQVLAEIKKQFEKYKENHVSSCLSSFVDQKQ